MSSKLNEEIVTARITKPSAAAMSSDDSWCAEDIEHSYGIKIKFRKNEKEENADDKAKRFKSSKEASSSVENMGKNRNPKRKNQKNKQRKENQNEKKKKNPLSIRLTIF